MEDVLEVYTRPYDPRFPQVCLDETSTQLLTHSRSPLPLKSGQPERQDYEYGREGVANLFMCYEPLAGWRRVMIRERRTKVDWAWCIKELVEVHYPEAERLVLVMDNLNTHTPAALYEVFPPQEARGLAQRLEIHYTPKHGSWLNPVLSEVEGMAEIELSILARQCLDRRIPDPVTLTQEVAAWEEGRNTQGKTVDWRFTTTDARIKLKHLYPSIQE
jgi:hypothetical protein